jgi:hypothetical protein
VKTKKIYISGGEVFDRQEIRDAFDEVRRMLNLGDETVLFGVPVDCGDIGAGARPSKAAAVSESANDATDVSGGADADEKPKRPRKKKEPQAINSDAEASAAPAAPMLSVLGILKAGAAPGMDAARISKDPDDDADLPPDGGPAAVSESADDADSDLPDAAPAVERAATIEDILDELEPLKEDKILRYDADTAMGGAAGPDDLDDDATLAGLAAEFAAAHDDIPEEPAPRGRIGKLKNILPFKKSKRDESSPLGDLFGWAGIAANDDDEKFAMPDFFRIRS